LRNYQGSGVRKKSEFLNLYTLKISGGLVVPAFFICLALGITASHRAFLQKIPASC
jgi:hypothetical protein